MPQLSYSSHSSDNELPSVDEIIGPIFLAKDADATLSDSEKAVLLFDVFAKVYANLEWRKVLSPFLKKPESCELVVYRTEVEGPNSLGKALNECIRSGEWRPLFEHPDLCYTPITRQLARKRTQQSASEPIITAYRTAKYLGTRHEVMLQAIDEIVDENKKKLKYISVLPVVQSSGTGKSKMIREIAHQRIVIPMCIREDNPQLRPIYPYCDEEVEDYLNRRVYESQYECENHYKGFLASLFNTARLYLLDCSKSSSTSYQELVKYLFDVFDDEDERYKFYNLVIDSATPSNDGALSEAWRSFENTLKRVCHDFPGYPVILAVDEAQSLLMPRSSTNDPPDPRYTHFLSALHVLSRENFCAVIISTDTLIFGHAPKSVPPFPQTIRNAILPPALTELPFDVNLYNRRLESGQETLKSVQTLKFLSRFGRPLWKSMYDSRMPEEPSEYQVMDITSEIMWIISKELCGDPPGVLSAPCKLDSPSIAILSSRLFLHLFTPTIKGRAHERNLIKSHLRLLYSELQSGDLDTGFSSEPLVSEAAARIMNLKTNHATFGPADYKPYMDVWALLKDFINSGLMIQPGHIPVGRLIGRTISILAMDQAIKRLQVDYNHSELRYQTPVLVNDYYKALLTADAWEDLRTSVPANQDKLTKKAATMNFETAFKSAYFRFSHYSEALDIKFLEDHRLWAVWLRGTALLFGLNVEEADRAIPIFFSQYKTLSPQSISCVLEHDRAKPEVDPSHLYAITADNLGIFKRTTNPYISVVHCYLHTAGHKTFTTHLSGSENGDDVMHPTRNEESPRYQLAISGLESYALLDGDARRHIQDMIDTSNNYGRHFWGSVTNNRAWYKQEMQ